MSAVPPTAPAASAPPPLLVGDGFAGPLARLLARHGLVLAIVPRGAAIPASYWGEPEAGLEATTVWARDDTPVHSVLHEACHVLCMDAERRQALVRDAGGDYAEENAVCCLQIVLADELPGVGGLRLMADMDAWGYTFRLGSARAWYLEEAHAARGWLRSRGLLGADGRASGRAVP